MSTTFERGQRVLVIDGLSQGRWGTVLGWYRQSEIGVDLWAVDVDNHRTRVIREDWLRKVAP